MEQIFGFCMCKKAEVENQLKSPSNSVEEHDDTSRGSTSSDDRRMKRSSSITDYRDVKLRFADSDEDQDTGMDGKKSNGDISPEGNTISGVSVPIPSPKRNPSPKPDAFVDDEGGSKVSEKTPKDQSRLKRESEERSEFRVLHDAVRKKRIALRKIHAKLKIDLNDMQKMREVLDSAKCAASANLPDVITTEQNCSEGDFMREFRQVFESALSEISEPTKELEEFTNKYNDMLARSPENSEFSDDALPSQVQSESQRLINDSERMLTMLHKAMRIAGVEYKLKLAFSDNVAPGEQRINELETALLELQRLKSADGLGFKETQPASHESPSLCSVRDTFSLLFPQERVLKLEKRSKLKLAELHIEALENRHRQTDTRQLLKEAIKKRSVPEIRTALEKAKEADLPTSDEVVQEAENLLQQITGKTENCRKAIREAIESSSMKELREGLKTAESLLIPGSDSLIEEGQKTLQDLENREKKLKEYLTDLKKAMKKKDAEEIQRLLVEIKSIKLTTGTKLVEEATNLLMYLKKYDQELKKDAMESARIRLVSSLELDKPQDIADILLRAQMTGLNNCVEIMGARTKLVQLQNDKERYSSELKKIEDYLEKLATRAGDNKATVDLIMTLERAIAVAESLEVSSEVKQRARGALHILKSRKEKVKSVKDELQRAVMECRQEAITCAIAEAESLPYFLTFDPLDGQIAAILEYAKNKISPSDTSSAPGDTDPAVRRVKSNLKRAMRGSSSSKLESAIALCRKTYGIPEKQENSEKNAPSINEDATNLIQRAERRCRRMKRREKIAEKEWLNVRASLRENLKGAMQENDRAELWKAVYQFKRELGSNMEKEDEKRLLEARKQLREVTIQQFKSNLSSALQDRDSTRLRHSLVELESPSLSMFPMKEDNKFKDDVARAKKLLGHLKEMERLKKAVSEMSRSQLAEIHRFPNPPTCVRAVMTATYVLLGENEKDLKDWTAVLRFLVKMGRESLTRRVAICSPTHIPETTALRVQEMLAGFTQTQVHDVNRGAAVFFGWANCVVTEVLDRHKDDPIKPTIPQKVHRTPQKPKEQPKDPVKSEFWNRLSRPRSSVPPRSVRSIKVDRRPVSAMK